jgi:metallophosphoesterase (TIGR03767 family)
MQAGLHATPAVGAAPERYLRQMRRLLAGILTVAALPAVALAADPLGKTTADMTVKGGDRAAGFSFLSAGPGEGYTVREGLGARPDAGRTSRRKSLTYFAQLTDFQLADEENPARVEATDPLNSPFESAHRPQEALMPHMIDQMIRQVNAHTSSPTAQAGGKHAAMGFAVLTGDNADSQSRNETEWVDTLLDGGTLNPNSGSADPADYAACPPGTPGPDEAAKYTGFQDYDDWAESTEFYDPDKPLGRYANWPSYPGLMDEAQKPFAVAGLAVPSYVAFGNHDGLVQGNAHATAEFESIATGCVKAFSASQAASAIGIDLASLIGTSPDKTVLVPPDPKRQYVDKAQYKTIFAKGKDGHGFGLIDAKVLQDSDGAAGYYSFKPSPGIRMIALDTVSDGGLIEDSADGNLDNNQFIWLEEQLKAATAADELAILFGHHSIQSLTSMTPDEAAPKCAAADGHAHDVNPGCDRDPRDSSPLRDGTDLKELMWKYPHAVAYVAGHSHVNDVVAFPKQGGGGFWNIRTSAEADWPHQQRLVELMDNGDGTLSIFGTLLDDAGPIEASPAGTAAAGLSPAALASLGRTIGFNDWQKGGGTGEGDREDRNVELLIGDPRRSRTVTSVRVTPKAKAGKTIRISVKVTRKGRAVRGAIVKALGKTSKTNRKGIATLKVRVPKGRKLTVTARKKGLRGLKVSVRVLKQKS